MTAEQLRNSILQEAISGRLVPQDPNDEPASVLLQRIREEKAKLVKEGKLKKKDLVETPITDDEKPFEIPSSWEWCRLGDVVYNRGQKTPEVEFSYIDIGSIDNKHQKLSEKDNIIQPNDAPSRARKIVGFGDIVYSTVRPYLHNIAIIDRTFLYEPIASTGFAVFTCFSGLLNSFLFYYLLSPAFDAYANDGDNAKGIAYPAITDKKLYNAPIPLPPLAEQKRIVAKLEELLPIVEQYGKAQTELDELNAALPARLRQSILQEAISGRLVPQDPNDEPASTLLARIREEKARLVKEGKLKKKDLVETPITEEEIPFEIPANWEWVRHNELFDISGGTQPPKSEFVSTPRNGYIQLYQIRDYGKNPQPVFIPYKKTLKISQQGDILLARYGGSLGKVFIAKDGAYNVAIAKVIPLYESELIDKRYLFLYYNSSIYQTQIKKHSRSAQAGFNKEDLEEMLFPLPPLDEQERIVAKIEELFTQIDKITK